jgi:hypothetical protein
MCLTGNRVANDMAGLVLDTEVERQIQMRVISIGTCASTISSLLSQKKPNHVIESRTRVVTQRF